MLKDGCVAEINDPELGPIRQVGITYRTDAENRARIQRTGARQPGSIPLRSRLKRPGNCATAPAQPPATGKTLRAPLAGHPCSSISALPIAGPYGTQLLSDLGAEVIKVNALLRYLTGTGTTSPYVCEPRANAAIALNLKDPRAMKRLA